MNYLALATKSAITNWRAGINVLVHAVNARKVGFMPVAKKSVAIHLFVGMNAMCRVVISVDPARKPVVTAARTILSAQRNAVSRVRTALKIVCVAVNIKNVVKSAANYATSHHVYSLAKRLSNAVTPASAFVAILVRNYAAYATAMNWMK